MTPRNNRRTIQNAAITDAARILEQAKQLQGVLKDAVLLISEGSKPDGYGSGQGYGGAKQSGISDRTYLDAIAKAERDPVEKNALTACRYAAIAVRVLPLAVAAATAATKEVSTVAEPGCLVCNEATARGWAGYCYACAQSWNRYRQQHPGAHEQFRAWRKINMNERVKDTP